MRKEISNLLETVFLQILKCHLEIITAGAALSVFGSVRCAAGESKHPERKGMDTSLAWPLNFRKKQAKIIVQGFSWSL